MSVLHLYFIIVIVIISTCVIGLINMAFEADDLSIMAAEDIIMVNAFSFLNPTELADMALAFPPFRHFSRLDILWAVHAERRWADKQVKCKNESSVADSIAHVLSLHLHA